MKIKAKLLYGGLALAIVPLIISSYITEKVATEAGARAIQDQAQQRLIAVRDMKKSEIENYFTQISRQVLTLADDRMIIEAMPRFTAGFHSFRQQASLGDAATLRDQLAGYYRQDFSDHFKALNPDRAIDAGPLLGTLGADGAALQYQYIWANPNPLGNKHKLDGAADVSAYSATHRLYHPHIRDFLEKFGYYDIFLVDGESGDVVYTVFKELDFATSLKDGAYAESGLGKVFQAANRLPAGEYAVEDFAPYLPSYNLAASFIATPVFDGAKRLGVLIFQMPIDDINRIMTLDEKWAEAGLGESGEVYLVGPDKTMRSMSRFLIEDADGYIAALEKSGHDKTLISRIKANGTTIGLQAIDTESARQAIAGRKGVHIIDDYRGEPVLSAFSPLDIPGLQWGILAEIDKAEAFRAVDDLSDLIMQSAVIVVLVMAGVAGLMAFFSAMKIVKPVLHLSEIIQEIERDSDLTRRIEHHGNDELGSMSGALNRMLEKIHKGMEHVAGSTFQVAAASEQLTNITTESNRSLQQQLLETGQVATAMTQMSSTVAEVANNTADAATAAETANKAASEGREIVRLTVDAIETLAGEVEASAELIAHVDRDSEAIGGVIDVILEIAEQTNLLALNAAIEAARAGEQGRGFAVVADEVRTLASRTKDSSAEIQQMIRKLQTSTQDAVQAMQKGRQRAHSSVEQATRAGKALEAIDTSVSSIHSLNTQIAGAAEEQSSVSEEIGRNLCKINQMAEQASEGASQTALSSEQLAQLAVNLQELVRQFKV
jgi:methyl-accepting chemotaxis protein